MHRGNHFGIPSDSSYSRMGRGGAYGSEDDMIETVKQFREFKPYLKDRLAQIRQTGRDLELQDQVEDIKFYLEVMKDILADESHGVDQLRSYIDKIHEMIRKNPHPLTDLPGVKKRTLDGNDDDFDDNNDRPRSPSQEPRGSDTAAEISSIPTHGAHRTVEVNFSGNERKEEVDEWGRPITFESTFTRREPYKGDIDMSGGYFQGSSGSGVRDQRWSEESDFSGARAAGRGMSMGRGAPMPPHHRYYQDIGHGRGRGYHSNDFDRRNEFYMDRPREPSKESGSELFGGGPPNGNKFDDWQSDPNFRGVGGRHSGEDERRMNHSDDRDREEKFHHAQYIAEYFERRPSSEGRGEDRQDDYISMSDRMNNAHQDYNHARRGPHAHSDGSGRPKNDRHDPRSRMDAGSPYTPNPATLINPITSILHPPQPSPMGYGVPPPSPHYTNAGLLPSPSPFAYANPPLLRILVPNAPSVVGMGHVFPNMGPAIPPIARPPMAFHRLPPPMPNYPVSELLPNFRHLPPSPYGSPPSHAATSHPPPQSPHSHMPYGRTKHHPRPTVNHTVQNRQHYPPRSKQTSRSDAGNVLRPSSSDPRASSRIYQVRKCQQKIIDRMKQHESSKSSSNKKGSKIQELRKQFEKEGFHRLGKPSKKTVSFEDALNAQVEESDNTRSKSGERSKSSSSRHGKDKESESDKQSQTDKTEKDRSPKRKSGEKGKGKEEKCSDKKKDTTSTNERTSRNKSSQLNQTDQQADKSSDSETREKPVDPTKPPAFKIPKKPRPQKRLEVESEKAPQLEDIQERGRSREKKKNTKRWSSLEKRHDAFKEMGFDTMLPLGLRRCTRGGQEEAAAETVESETPVPTVVPTDVRDETVDQPSQKEKPVESEIKISSGRKRGSPPKDSPKKNRLAKPIVQEVELDEEPEGEMGENATRRGKKRKQKVAKATPRKRTKKAGPMTRAQAALKNMKDLPKASGSKEGEEESKSEGDTLRKITKAANNVVIRRLTRKRIGTKDTVVNKGMCKIKLESDFKAKVKTEPTEPDPFLNTSVNHSNNDQNYHAELAVLLPASIETPTSTSTTKGATTEEESPISEPSNTSTPTTNTPNIPEEIEKSADPSTFVSLQMHGTCDESSDAQVSFQGSKKKKSIPVINLDDESSLASTTSANGQEEVRVKMEMDDASIDRDDSSIKKVVFSTKCEKCNFSGKTIVSHYVNKHYPCQIPQARLMPAAFNGLIELNTSESPQFLEIVLDENAGPIWPCIYCNLRFHKILDFHDHLTSHTGEFRFECTECLMSYPQQKLLENHLKSHKGATGASIKLNYPSDIQASARELTGYLCNDCFYFQLRFENITRHIDQSGHSSLDVKSLRLIRPPLPETVDKKPNLSQTGIVKEPEALTEVTPYLPEDLAGNAAPSAAAERVFYKCEP